MQSMIKASKWHFLVAKQGCLGAFEAIIAGQLPGSRRFSDRKEGLIMSKTMSNNKSY
jgi:hypothetical protein